MHSRRNGTRHEMRGNRQMGEQDGTMPGLLKRTDSS
jgi:hypothetical protein